MQSEIVIVGGGAAGLELACKLGRRLGPARVVLVDCRLYHIWKPSLHEVAAGTLNIHQEGLSYQMLAHDNGFTFMLGRMIALDTQGRHLTIGPVDGVADGEGGLPERRIGYGSLVIAVGSTSNYFGVPGAREHTISLNATEDAERFRLKLLRLLAGAGQQGTSGAETGLDVVIIGGGATGVELAAELREASSAYAIYGANRGEVRRDMRITLLEGAPRILAPLPERVSSAALRLLGKRAIKVVNGCQVTSIENDKVHDAKCNVYPADPCVWAAGIRAPRFLASLGLPTTPRGGQIEVDGTLRVRGVPGVWAMGDCASCTDANGKPVPPRAQAAHQQASYLCDLLTRLVAGKPVPEKAYVYRDYGSLVSIGHRTTVGNLMGALRGFSWFVEGFVARIMYVSLHLMHHRAILGTVRTGMLAVARFLIRRTTSLVKLH